MRAAAHRLLGPDDGPDALPPAADEADTLVRMLRGHLAQLTPAVEKKAGKPNSIPRYCALACVGEARRKLSATPGTGTYGLVAYGRRLARVLNALCEHYEKLSDR